jgi:hypothetical protein
MEILPFDEVYLPQVINLMMSYWNQNSDEKISDDLNNLIYEFTVKNNYYHNEYNYMIIENNVVKAIIFGYRYGQKNDAIGWLESQKKKLNVNEISNLEPIIQYITGYDQLMDSYLTINDLKISLFISSIPGGGTALLNHFFDKAKSNAINEIYLWTDTTCNHTYYPKRGFDLFFTESNNLDETSNETIDTLFYKKKISN